MSGAKTKGAGLGTVAVIAALWLYASSGGHVDDRNDPHHITVSGRWPSDASARVVWKIGEIDRDNFVSSAGSFSQTRIVPVGKYSVTVSIKPTTPTIGSTVVSVSWLDHDVTKNSAKDFPMQGQQIFVTVTIH